MTHGDRRSKRTADEFRERREPHLHDDALDEAPLPAASRDLNRVPVQRAPDPRPSDEASSLLREAEEMSGQDLGSVSVRYDSPRPASLGASAIAQGDDF